MVARDAVTVAGLAQGRLVLGSVAVDVNPARYDAAADAYVNMFGAAVDDPATAS